MIIAFDDQDTLSVCWLNDSPLVGDVRISVETLPLMDAQDLRLIGLSRENARMSVAQLAKQLGVSRGTVQNRIDRLIADNVLLGFTVRTTPEAAAHRVRAIMSIAVEGDRVEGDRSDAILRTLRGYPEVQALYTTNGRWDIVAEIGTEGLEKFDEVLRRIRGIKGVANSETSLLLSTQKL